MVVKITNQCINNDGFLVTVHAEKKTKRIPWQRGESYLRMKMRVPDSSTGNVMGSFSRRPGKI